MKKRSRDRNHARAADPPHAPSNRPRAPSEELHAPSGQPHAPRESPSDLSRAASSDAGRDGGGPLAHRDATRDALLAAGRALFARHGYDGASVRAITSRAGANLGAITYHFGSKRALYDEVVRGCAEPLADAVVAAASSAGAPLDRVDAAVRTYLEHLRANPDLPRLMVQELALGHRPPRAAGPTIARVHGALAALVREGQADGSMRAGDPTLLAIGVLSHPVHLVLVGGALKAILGLDLGDPAVRARVLDHVAAFARAALAAHAEAET